VNRLPASDRQVQKLRHAGILPRCEALLREHGIETWSIENGGKHANLVYEQAGVTHRYPMPGSSNTKGKHAVTFVVGNLRRKLEGRGAR